MNLSEKHRNMLHEILDKHFSDCRILLFGSRATGKAKVYSDIDIAINCHETSMPISRLADAKQDFVESDLPFIVDLVDLNNIDSSFKTLIEKQSKELTISI